MQSRIIALCSIILLLVLSAENACAGKRRCWVKCCKHRYVMQCCYRTTRCTPQCYCQPDLCYSYSYAVPCYCLLEDLFVIYLGGGSTFVYLAERHEDGCSGDPNGHCDSPTLVTVTQSSLVPAQDCEIPNQCSLARVTPRNADGLSHPLDPNFSLNDVTGRFRYQPHIKHIAREIYEADIKFDHKVSGREVWAKVFLVKIPSHLRTVNGVTNSHRERLVAIGAEVDPHGRSAIELPKEYVKVSRKHDYIYQVKHDDVKYSIFIKQ